MHKINPPLRSSPGKMARRHAKATLGRQLEDRLASYALCAGAAGVGILAAACPAEAQIVYTAANISFGVNSTTNIDFNNDGIADLTVKDTFVSGTDAFMVRAQTGSCAHILGADVFLTGGMGQAVGGPLRGVSYLQSGAVIGSHDRFRGTLIQNMGTDFCNSHGPQEAGQWLHHLRGATGYLGAEFKISGHRHYGWVKLSIDICRAGDFYYTYGLCGTVLGYAYNAEDGAPILAGQTQDISPSGELLPDEPTLGALALGSIGLPLWRPDSSPR